MSGSMETLAQVRQLLQSQGAPMTTENLNRAMLMLAQGQMPASDASNGAMGFDMLDNAVERTMQPQQPGRRNTGGGAGNRSNPYPGSEQQQPLPIPPAHVEPPAPQQQQQPQPAAPTMMAEQPMQEEVAQPAPAGWGNPMATDPSGRANVAAFSPLDLLGGLASILTRGGAGAASAAGRTAAGAAPEMTPNLGVTLAQRTPQIAQAPAQIAGPGAGQAMIANNAVPRLPAPSAALPAPAGPAMAPPAAMAPEVIPMGYSAPMTQGAMRPAMPTGSIARGPARGQGSGTAPKQNTNTGRSPNRGGGSNTREQLRNRISERTAKRES
jgi:hypothetical protein